MCVCVTLRQRVVSFFRFFIFHFFVVVVSFNLAFRTPRYERPPCPEYLAREYIGTTINNITPKPNR